MAWPGSFFPGGGTNETRFVWVSSGKLFRTSQTLVYKTLKFLILPPLADIMPLTQKIRILFIRVENCLSTIGLPPLILPSKAKKFYSNIDES